MSKAADIATESHAYNPEAKERDTLVRLKEQFQTAYQQNSRGWRQLRNLDIDSFMQRCRDHYNGFVDESAEQEDEDWRSNMFKRESRQKVMSVVAAFVSSGLGIEISAQDLNQRLDRVMSKTVDEVYNWTLEREQFEYKFVRALLEMVITGTVHMQEEIVWDTREVKEITDIDFQTGKVGYEKKERTMFKGCRLEFVPNSEMYPGDVWTHDVQEQPFLFRRKITTYEDAQRLFYNRPNWKFVQPNGNFNFATTEEFSEIDDDDTGTNVEILYYWCKADDEFHIVANGVLLTDPDNPIPYPHKEYPIIKSVYETFADSRFYWGDSLVNKNFDMQQMVNELINNFNDSIRLKTFPPLLTTNAELASTDLVIPGMQATIDVDDEIRTIPEIAKGLGSDQFNMLSLLTSEIDGNAAQSLTQRQIQDSNLATEIRALVGSAEQVKELNEQFVSSFLLQIARIRIPNMLWFMTHDDEYNKVVLDEVKTKSKKEGKRIIRFVDVMEIPTSEQIFRAQLQMEKKGDPTDFVFVNKDKVQDYRYHTRLSATRVPSRTAASRLSRVFSKFRIHSQNQLIDQVWNTKNLLRALGDDEELAMVKPGTAQGPNPSQVKLPPNSPQLDKALTESEQDPVARQV